jgi:hypothetical protein
METKNALAGFVPANSEYRHGQGQIPKQSLEHLALIEIRAYSGCEDVLLILRLRRVEKQTQTGTSLALIALRKTRMRCTGRNLCSQQAPRAVPTCLKNPDNIGSLLIITGWHPRRLAPRSHGVPSS